jgi:geranylgeranyl diphosphate synthase type II
MQMADSFSGDQADIIHRFREQVNQWLDAYTLQLDSPPRLREAIRYCLLAPGKRLRPILALLACRACRGEIERAFPAACALEMIHTYSLVHDDLPAMDDDELRRGRPTCHIQYDEATAILVGDSLLTMAFEVVSNRSQTARECCRCVGILAHAAGYSELIGGQFDDLAAQNRLLTIDELASIHLRKTARLFAAASELGGVIAGADEQRIAQLTQFGRSLGYSFQIIDDLLDVQGNENRLGKRTQKDQTRGKSTFPALIGIEASHRQARHLIDEAIGHLEGLGDDADALRQWARQMIHRTQ